MSHRLHPSRAALHPAWLGSLVLLAANDHWLKTADLLPAAITGKLSDLAGLMVAPLVLAIILRVRTTAGWWASHAAVGLGFSALQLSATVAAATTAATAALGIPWTITRDPTDLFALPMLLVSAWGLRASMQRRPAANARRSAEVAAATVGLACCVATSYDEPGPCCDEPPDDTWGGSEDGFDDDGEPPSMLPDIRADVFLHNQTEDEVVVRLRQLRPEVLVDCDAVEGAPGELLRSELFEPASAWTMPVGTNLAVRDPIDISADCYAVWVEADTLPPTVLWWRQGQISVRSVPGDGSIEGPGEVALSYGDPGLQLRADDDIVFESAPVEPSDEGECMGQPDGSRLAWSAPEPVGPATLDSIDEGPDGCLALGLQRTEQVHETWYVCIPSTSFPFAVGDRIDIHANAAQGSVEVIALDEIDHPDPDRALVLFAGTWLPNLSHLGVELGELPLFDCALTSEPVCGTVARSVAMIVGGPDLDAVQLHAGDGPVRFAGDGREVEATLLHGQDRVVLDPQCALGPGQLGHDVEFAIATWPTAPGH